MSQGIKVKVLNWEMARNPVWLEYKVYMRENVGGEYGKGVWSQQWRLVNAMLVLDPMNKKEFLSRELPSSELPLQGVNLPVTSSTKKWQLLLLSYNYVIIRTFIQKKQPRTMYSNAISLQRPPCGALSTLLVCLSIQSGLS